MSFFVYEACSLVVGDDGPDNFKSYTIDSVKLPRLEEKSQDHMGGGAIGEIAVGNLGISKLEVPIKLKGFDPQFFSQFGANGQRDLPYTIRGLFRDKKGGAAVQVRSIVRGRLASVEMEEFRRGDLVGTDYMIHQILHYELYFDQKELFYWDYFTSSHRVNGVSQNEDFRNILAIPGNA